MDRTYTDQNKQAYHFCFSAAGMYSVYGNTRKK